MASTPATHYSAIFSEGQDVDESDSDIELDILRNFEELAKTSFFKENYGKAEQFLRKAIERLTGESSSSPKFRTLMLQLALSCALQEKWDAAASILTTFKKPTSTADVPVLCLFQAVALGYLQSDKLEESYQACKTALQGKKKLCGKESEEYFDCLALLAKICDAKGDEFEAEAVRHSIPPAVPIQIPSGGKSYVEANISKFFIFFLESSDDSPRAELRSPTDEDISRLSLIRRDGISCADANDRSGKQIGESDTGKEMTVVVGPPAAPLRDFPEPRKANPSDYSNIREGELDSGKELVMPNSTGPTTQSQSQIVIRHELDASHPSAVPQVPDQRPTPINPRTWILSSDVVSNVIAVGIALTVSNVTFADYVGSSPVGGGQIYVGLSHTAEGGLQD